MAKFTVAGFPLLRAALLGTTALALIGATDAVARVGVTSATDGDPLGKPPTEAERVLRIGIDVQANELITTGNKDRAHLVFLDGTSLTVGPNAQLTIDRFVYDPATKTGDLAVNASKGVFRLVGGRISKTKPIVITTPSSTIGIRGGITIFNVEQNNTTSTFVFGNGMTVSAAGQTQTVTRPGSQVTTNSGGAPGQPTLVRQGGLNSQLSQLEGTSSGSGAEAAARQVAAMLIKARETFRGKTPPKAPLSVNRRPVARPPGPTAQSNANVISNALTNVSTEEQETQAETQRRQTGQPAPPPPAPPQVVPPPPAPPQVIVTRGRFFKEVPYVENTFNNQTLAVTPNPLNNASLNSSGNVANGQATFTLSDGRSVTLPYQPNGVPFPVSVNDPTFGPLAGFGIVSANRSYFAYFLFNSSNKRLGVVGGTPTTFAQFPKTGFAQHILFNLGNPGALPFSNDTVGGNAALLGAASVSPLYSVYSSNIAPVVGGAAPGPQGANSMQATISIAGQGTSQKSYMGVFIGEYFMDYNNGTVFNSGSYNASYRLDATQKIGRETSAVSTFDTGGGNAIFGADTDAMVYTPDGLRSTVTTAGGIVTATSTTRTPQASFEQPYNNLNGSDYFSLNAALKTPTPSNLGQTRTTQTVNGFVGGVAEKRDSSGNFSTRAFGTTNAQPTDVVLVTDASANRASAAVTVREWDGYSTSATFQLGGTSGPRFATTSFVDDQTYAMRDRPADVLTNTTSVSVYSNTSTGLDVQSRTALVSYNVAPAPSFFAGAGVTPCTCEFLTWGWWGGDVRYNAGSVYNPNGRDRINLATYVAGTLTNFSQLPNTGAATYTGHAVGNVVNGSASYVAAGTYTNTWNFASQTGAVAISNFDGASYSGTATLTPGTVQFNASLTGAGRTGAVNGAFFNSPTVPAKYQAGSFSVTGSGYKAGGTFAAQKPGSN